MGHSKTVNTSQEYYSHAGIVYMGLRLVDVTQTNISRRFPEVRMKGCVLTVDDEDFDDVICRW